MASLHSAVSFIEVDVVAVFVAKHLNFDVSGPFDVLFNNHVVVFKPFHCLVLGRIQLLVELAFIPYNSHALAASAEGSFKHDWESNFLGLLQEEGWILAFAVVARNNWNFSSFHDFL